MMFCFVLTAATIMMMTTVTTIAITILSSVTVEATNTILSCGLFIFCF